MPHQLLPKLLLCSLTAITKLLQISGSVSQEGQVDGAEGKWDHDGRNTGFLSIPSARPRMLHQVFAHSCIPRPFTPGPYQASMQHSLPRAEAWVKGHTKPHHRPHCTEVALSTTNAELPSWPRHLLLNSFIARDPPKTRWGTPVLEPRAATHQYQFTPLHNTPPVRVHLSC